MFRSVLDYVRTLENTAESTKAFLYRVRGGRRRLTNKIIKAEEGVKLLKSPEKYIRSIIPALTEEILSAAKNNLAGKAIEAIRENYEFDNELYTTALFDAIDDNETYKVMIKNTGMSTLPKVDIDLNRTAGRLNRWATGVKITRQVLKTKVPNKNNKRYELTGLQASKAWAGIFRDRGSNDKFKNTIRLRLQNSGSKASFWKLLDAGDVPMASDRGGYSTPSKTSTNFESEAEAATNEYAQRVMQNQRDTFINAFIEYNSFLDEAKALLVSIDNLIESIRFDVSVVKNAESRLSSIYGQIDSTKLEQVVNKIRDRLLVSGKINLAPTGAKIRYVPVTKIVESMY
jgi:hypothetical protein